MRFLLFFIFLVLSIYGLSEFLHFLKIKLLVPRGKKNLHIVIKLDEDSAISQLAFVGEQYLWYGNKYADLITADIGDLSKATALECENLAKRYNIKII